MTFTILNKPLLMLLQKKYNTSKNILIIVKIYGTIFCCICDFNSPTQTVIYVVNINSKITLFSLSMVDDLHGPAQIRRLQRNPRRDRRWFSCIYVDYGNSRTSI